MACAAITERPKSQFISHDNSVIKLTSRKQGGLEAEFYHLDEGSRAFTENSDNRIVWAPRNFKLHMVTAKCVAERRTGLHLPCILVSRAKKNKNFVNYFVFLSHEKKEFLAVGKFRTSYDLEMVDCVCLCDGPLACWRKGHDWYYTSLYGIDEWMDVQKAPSLIGIHTLLHLKMVENYVVAMGTRRTIQDDAANSKFWDNECVLVAFDPKGQRGQGDSDMHLESDLFIPHAYANIVTCVYVSGPIRLPVSSKSGGNHKMDEKGNNLIFVGTSQGQLLEFRDGKITKCCGLGFSDLGNISVATVTGGNDVIIVRSVNRGQACAVLMENFLIMKSWETVCDVFVDDFLQCGCDQILLLHREESLIGYTLTDLQTDISDDANLGDYATCNEGDSSSLSKAVIALESRLQVSLASLRDAETLYDTKFDVLRQSCKSLYSMASGKEGNGVQDKPCLVCLYDGCEQQETEPYQYAKSKVRCQMSYSVSQDEVETSRAWQYTVNGKWVIGVKVENKKNQSICNLCLSLVPITGVMSDNVVSTSTCKLPLITKFDHNCDFYSKRQGNPPPRKKHKNAPDKCHKATLQPGSQLDVIAVTTLPHFSDKGVCQCSLVLQWREKSGMKGVKQCESNLQKSLCIGMALLTAADVAFGKYDVFSSFQVRVKVINKHIESEL
ncbi:Fanconi anemia group B protein-like [Saccoglossus kowalevskii]